MLESKMIVNGEASSFHLVKHILIALITIAFSGFLYSYLVIGLLASNDKFEVQLLLVYLLIEIHFVIGLIGAFKEHLATVSFFGTVTTCLFLTTVYRSSNAPSSSSSSSRDGYPWATILILAISLLTFVYAFLLKDKKRFAKCVCNLPFDEKNDTNYPVDEKQIP